LQPEVAEAWDLLPDGMVLVSREGTIAKENSQLATMFGYEIGELTGSPIEILLPVRRQRPWDRWW